MGDGHEERRGKPTSERQTVPVRGSAAGFAQEIVAGPHRLTSEPVSEGGRDTGLRLTKWRLRLWVAVLP